MNVRECEEKKESSESEEDSIERIRRRDPSNCCACWRMVIVLWAYKVRAIGW